MVLVGLIAVHLLFLVALGNQKVNYHVDEFLTYGLSNHPGSIHLSFEDGKTYQGIGGFQDYLTAAPGNLFDYKNVWENQKMDVHPPFYYSVIHTISSLVPGTFSKWIGLIPNFICMVMIDLFLFMTARRILGRWESGVLVMAINGLSLMNLNMMMFIRMYAMLTACVLAIGALHVAYFRKPKLDVKFYIGLLAGTVWGVMTQYYFLIFLFFLCLYFGVRLLCQKRWKDAVGYAGTLAAAGAVSIGIFPEMLEQIFGSGQRGKEAFSNFGLLEGYYTNLKEYYRILSDQLFGGEFFAVLLLAAVFLFMLVKKGDSLIQIGKSVIGHELAMLAAAAGGYVMLVAKVAPYQTDRYVMPVSPYILLIAVSVLYKLMEKCFGKDRQIRIRICVAAVFLTFMVLEQNRLGMFYTYQDTQEQLDIAGAHREESVLYVYDVPWKALPNAEELKQYRDYQFTKEENLDQVVKSMDQGKFVLYITKDLNQEEIIQKVMDERNEPYSCTMIYAKYNANVYALEKKL